MGLDNGLLIKGKTEKGRAFLEKSFSANKDDYYYDTDDKNTPVYEFAYYRKCFNMRDRMFQYGLLEDCGDKILSIKDLETMRNEVLKYFLNEDNWVIGNSFSNGSIWEWEEMIGVIGENISDISRLLRYIESDDITDADLEIWTYDSY